MGGNDKHGDYGASRSVPAEKRTAVRIAASVARRAIAAERAQVCKTLN